VRDPYDILGVKRGATFDEIKAAYKSACKRHHPDNKVTGSHEAFVELRAAYDFILNEIKSGYQQQQQEEAKQRQSAAEDAWHNVNDDATQDASRDRYWRNIYRDIDEELETIRRAAEQYDEQLRTMRRAAWQTGHHAEWAKLTWDDLVGFITRTARSGVKGLALIFAALVGVGTVLVEANLISALILLGSALGFAFSLSVRSDKGGVLSAALLLFGVMTIWLPPVRNSLFLFPIATISVLVLLALIFKFGQQGGTVGLMTGGVLALYVIVAILNDTAQRPQVVITPTPQPYRSSVLPAPPVSAPIPARIQPVERPVQAPPPPPAPPEPRTLLASDGAILKFVAGVPYHLKVRSGRSTSLRATQGRVTFSPSESGNAECVDSLDFPTEFGTGPWRDIDRALRACGGDAIMAVSNSK